MGSTFWLVSLPLDGGSADRTWSVLQDKTTRDNDLSANFKFNVPELRVGTLDSLLALSDDLVKVNTLVEAVAQKIQRQVVELASSESEIARDLTVDGVSAGRFLTDFAWDEAKHPARRPLRETVDKLQESVAKVDDEFKLKTSEYTSVKSQLNGLTRKAAGSLATRDLGELVQGADLVDTENLTTLCVAVPKYSQKEWLESYETLAQFIVPRSSKLLKEDGDYALYTVTLFRRVVDAFKSAAREKSFQVREFTHDAEIIEAKVSERNDLKMEVEERRAAMYEWCQTSYGEVFSAWVHVCAIRVFVESILRYGLPPSFQASVMHPHKKTEKKLRAVLSNTFGQGASSHWNDDPGEEKSIGGEDTHPYVSFKIEV
mmetsp:Transcript_7242/g.11381  ORF Transcript_7242/g.11381 Transcript_7242/m.11381 type:complete len:373 (-) Transcript_7242:2780-3898(-)